MKELNWKRKKSSFLNYSSKTTIHPRHHVSSSPRLVKHLVSRCYSTSFSFRHSSFVIIPTISGLWAATLGTDEIYQAFQELAEEGHAMKSPSFENFSSEEEDSLPFQKLLEGRSKFRWFRTVHPKPNIRPTVLLAKKRNPVIKVIKYKESKVSLKDLSSVAQQRLLEFAVQKFSIIDRRRRHHDVFSKKIVSYSIHYKVSSFDDSLHYQKRLFIFVFHVFIYWMHFHPFHPRLPKTHTFLWRLLKKFLLSLL